MGGGVTTIPEQCAVVYWTRLGFRYGPGPVLKSNEVDANVASIESIGGSDINVVTFACGGPIPPDSSPGAPPCPTGTVWDPATETCVAAPPSPTQPPGQPPAPPPPFPPVGGGGDGGDEITILIQLIEQIIVQIKLFIGAQPGKLPPLLSEKCCLEITGSIALVAKGLVDIAAALPKPGSSAACCPPVDFAPLLAELTALVAAVKGFPAPIVNVTVDNPTQDFSAIVAQLKRSADTMNGFPPDEPTAQAKVRDLAKLAVEKYGFPADLAQLLT